MKIENQVITLEQAKRLKELGIEQDSYFVWGVDKKSITEAWSIEGYEDDFCSAFTVSELGVLLPDIYDKMQWVSIANAGYNSKSINMEPPNCFSVHIGDSMSSLDHESFDQELYPTEAQARGAYLIMLLEEKQINIIECNKRLTES